MKIKVGDILIVEIAYKNDIPNAYTLIECVESNGLYFKGKLVDLSYLKQGLAEYLTFYQGTDDAKDSEKPLWAYFTQPSNYTDYNKSPIATIFAYRNINGLTNKLYDKAEKDRLMLQKFCKKPIYKFQVMTEYETRFVYDNIVAHSEKEMWEYYIKHHNLKKVVYKAIVSSITLEPNRIKLYFKETKRNVMPCLVDKSFAY